MSVRFGKYQVIREVLVLILAEVPRYGPENASQIKLLISKSVNDLSFTVCVWLAVLKIGT
jgi:hypothetical protein